MSNEDQNQINNEEHMDAENILEENNNTEDNHQGVLKSIDQKLEQGIEIYQMLAMVQLQKNQLHQCITSLLTAVLLTETFLGKVHFKVAQIKSHIGGILVSRKFYEKAIEYSRQSLQVLEKLEHKDSAFNELYLIVLNNISIAYTRMEKYTQAEQFYVKIQNFLITDKKEDSEKYAQCLNGIAICHFRTNRVEEALEFYNKGLRILERHQGEQGFDMTDLTNILMNIANIYTSRKDYDKALECYEKCFLLTSTVHKEQHISYADILRCIGTIYVEKKEIDKALPILSKSLQIFTKFKVQNVNYVRAISYLAKVMHQKQNYQKAIELLFMSMQLLKQLGQQENIPCANVYLLLGQALEKVQKYERASEFGLMAKTMYEEKVPFGNQLIVRSDELMSRCEQKLNEQRRAQITLFATQYFVQNQKVDLLE